MDNQLQSISKIFTERLYRIPDYQRGYAWTEKQLKDFWSDIIQLEENKNHYVGVLTLEKVPNEIYSSWTDDKWIINSKNFEPYYVVDGQQRLTTTIVLIQAITEISRENDKLNYTSINEIRKRYIFDSKDEGISRSYIFGYEKDNPSYEFLKTKIFNENSSSGYLEEETIYTHNLESAKEFFLEKLKTVSPTEVENIYKKITQNFLFNIYSISSDIDVFIAFETMNNRGKPLSNLELLKNRLIYLSTKFQVAETEKNKLRRVINDSWKAIYHNLGKNKDNPLDDDLFLVNHFIMYFGEEAVREEDISSRNIVNHWYRENYIIYLLEKKFTAKNILGGKNATNKLKLQDVHDYSENLQQSVIIWYDLFNPLSSKRFNDEEKYWLEKLNRFNIIPFAPLLLSCYLSKITKNDSITLLKLLEKYAFISSLSMKRIIYQQQELQIFSHRILNKKKTTKEIIKSLQERIDQITSREYFLEVVIDKFKHRGFYEWDGLRYFLFEYELNLKESSKTKREKLNWDTFKSEYDDYVTIEHIYPQTSTTPCWNKNFKKFNPREKKYLLDSLGNLLPLSRPKNSSLQNRCFIDKIDNNKDNVGYRYGSYSEIEVSKLSDWTPEDILDRGMRLLSFIEKRWNITLGERQNKLSMLNLKFLDGSTAPSTVPSKRTIKRAIKQ